VYFDLGRVGRLLGRSGHEPADKTGYIGRE
jgi:hypothetical protein